MNGPVFFGCYIPATINFITQYVKDPTKRLGTNRNGNRLSGIDCFHSPHHAISRSERDTAYPATPEVLLNLSGYFNFHTLIFFFDSQSIINSGQRCLIKFRIES